MKIAFLILSMMSLALTGWAQRTIEYKASLTGQTAKQDNLPFWATTNRYGIVPDASGGLLQAGLFSDFNAKRKIQVAYGVSAAGYMTKHKKKVLIDELYFSAKWEKLRLDLGMIHPDEEYNGISSQNGSIINSANARSMPGYNLRSDFIRVPLTGEVLAFKFNWSDYVMIDDRYVDNTRLHNKSLYLRITPWHRLDITVGLEHYAQWAGKSPIYGKQPDSFRDYVRICCAQSGGSGATRSDSINVLGNHLGREHIRINYKADNYTLSFYHDIPFEDGSGTHFANFPDGTYGLYYGAKDRKQWISDVMYELVYTKKQSGSRHDRKATPEEQAKQDPHDPFYGRVVLGGNDNYFNNGEYKSGWTYYGRTIGTPFITPKEVGDLTLGVYNNRVLAHYLGIQGYFMHKMPYKLRLAYSLNYGTHNLHFTDGNKEQFSFSLEAGVLRQGRAPFHLDVGVYGDYGSLLKDNVGVSVTLTRKGRVGGTRR